MEEINGNTNNGKATSKTNYNKINGNQKEILAEFMLEHPDLAKNKLKNCAQARQKSQNLWRQLALKLNSRGPPTKEVFAWRKVYADQKHNTKKKLSQNKASKKKTGGGPFNEIMLTSTEEQLVEAAGLTAAVAGLVGVQCFGSKTNECTDQVIEIDGNASVAESLDENENEPISSVKLRKQKSYTNEPKKIQLIKENMTQLKGWQNEIGEKLSKVIQLKEKALQIKEETNAKLDKIISLKEKDLRLKEVEHKAKMSSKELELQIRTLELQVLNQNCLHGT